METETVPIEDVFESPSNPRRNDDAVEHVAASLRRFGWQQPIVARDDGEVIAGNTRLKAAKSIGMTEVPVVRFEGSAMDAVAYQIADNRTGEFASWEDQELTKLLRTLRDEDSLEGVGFDEKDIDQLLADMAADADNQVDDPGPEDPPEAPVTVKGDLWLLGDHRLLCGDSTSADDVERLLDGHKPALMVTDPPYGVKLDQGWRDRREGVGLMGKAQADVIHQDDGFEWIPAMSLAACSVAYVWHAAAFASTVQEGLLAAGYEVRQQIVWAKTVAPMGRSAYQWKHEPCWYAVRKGATAGWVGGRKETTVWEAASPKHIMSGSTEKKEDHPTQKPLECMATPIRNHSGDVYEPFMGSGTTLIASEQLGRKCYGIEISPAYVDVALKRWMGATGKQATLDGKTWDEVQDARG